MIQSAMTKFLSILNQIRVFHWQTKSFAEHEALGKLYGFLDTLIDEFVEVFSGRHGEVPKANEVFDAKARNYVSNADTKAYLDEIADYLGGEVNDFIEDDTELANIRDEMLAAVNRTKYLLGLS